MFYLMYVSIGYFYVLNEINNYLSLIFLLIFIVSTYEILFVLLIYNFTPYTNKAMMFESIVSESC